MSHLVQGTVGDLDAAESTDAVCVSHLADVNVTVKASADIHGSAAMTVEISQDGTRWAATPTSSAFDGTTTTSGVYALTGRVNFIRATASACAAGSFAIRYSGRVADHLPFRNGTLGNLASQAAGTAVDISDLEQVIVTSTGGSGNTTDIQTSYNGTDWVTVGTLVTTTDSLLIPLPAKLLRANCTTYSATEYVRYGGHKTAGKQRFGTLGDFTTDGTGTAVDVSDLNAFDVRVVCSDTGTFAYSGNVLLEASADGVSWALLATHTSTGTTAVTKPYKLLRARTTSLTVGSVAVRFGGVNNDLVG
jgi:hypothetical protein